MMSFFFPSLMSYNSHHNLLQVDAAFPEKYHGANVKLTFTVPRSSTGASIELEPGAKGQSALIY